jgi:hypothetical protein
VEPELPKGRRIGLVEFAADRTGFNRVSGFHASPNAPDFQSSQVKFGRLSAKRHATLGYMRTSADRFFLWNLRVAGIAQLVEHLICNHLRTQHSCGLAGTLAPYLAVPDLTVLQPAAVGALPIAVCATANLSSSALCLGP